MEADLNELLDEKTQASLRSVINDNYSTDDLRTYLEKDLELKEDQKKMLFKFWKAHGRAVMQLIEEPVTNNTQGIKQIDWEINLTTHSRHQSNIQKKSATVQLVPRQQKGNSENRVLFEISKQDVNLILEKIDSVM